MVGSMGKLEHCSDEPPLFSKLILFWGLSSHVCLWNLPSANRQNARIATRPTCLFISEQMRLISIRFTKLVLAFLFITQD